MVDNSLLSNMMLQLIDVACIGRKALHSIKKKQKTYHQKFRLCSCKRRLHLIIASCQKIYNITSNQVLLKHISRKHTHVKSLSTLPFFLSPYKSSIFLSHTHHSVVGVYSYSVISLFFIPIGKAKRAADRKFV